MSLKILMPDSVSYIIKTLYAHGYEAYAVGGCVRDAILGREAHDWDITTSAKPQEVKALFRRTIDTGLQHGTVTVMIDHTGYEVTTYRIDGEYEDARHPKEVIFTGDLLEDLKRRDFTINAMAYNDQSGLVDAFDGVGDLERGIIRCVGAPHDRFSEDALRMLRAVRFAAQLGFSIEPDTRAAIADLAPTIAKVSAERIASELLKLLTSAHPMELRTAWETGLTAVFLPEFDRMMETPQHNKHHCYSVGEHTLHALEGTDRDKVLRLAMLLHDIAKPQTKTTDEEGWDHFYGHPEAGEKEAVKILRRLKLDNDTIRRVAALVRWHDDRPVVTERNVRWAINRIGEEQFPALFAVKRADIGAQSAYQRQEKLEYVAAYEACYLDILVKKQCISKKDLALNGKDLIAAGIRPGKEMGMILDSLFGSVLDDPSLNEREVLMELVKKQWLT